MAAIDADHAVASDPERYSIEAVQPITVPLTLEQRIARIENRLGPETPQEIFERNRRAQEMQERADEEREQREADARAELDRLESEKGSG